MLKQATQNLDHDDCIFIHCFLDGSLLSLKHLLAHSKTLEQLILGLLFADDAALVAHTEQAMQHVMTCFAKAAQQFDLEVGLKKTEVLLQPAPKEPHHPPHVNTAEQKAANHFVYLGWLAKANCAFGRLYKKSGPIKT